MDKTHKKTIFIVISQTIIIRNILRSGVFRLLLDKGHKLVIFINCKKLPEYINEEFRHPLVTIIPINEFSVGKAHRKFIELTHLLLYTKTTKRYFKYSRHFLEKNRIVVFFHLVAMRILSGIPFLKPLVRFIEQRLFKEMHPWIEKYFDEHTPDLVFSTSITSKPDNVFMKAARRRGIRTVSMPKSWDTVTKMYYRFVPDYFIVQNEHLKKELINLQQFAADKIYVSGFPQFDWYRKEEIIRSREEHFAKMGLDPKLPLILFGSQGSWYDKDYKIAEKIYEWIKHDELIKPAQILFRPHFSNVKTNEFRKYRGMPKAAYDSSYHITEDFRDNWDPTTSETIDFVNTIAHADVVVIILSTLALDAACRDKPVINVVFGSRYRKGKDITPLMQYSNHYEWVFNTNATFRAHNFQELKEFLNVCLRDPSVKRKEREDLRNKVCYKVDGRACERIAEALEVIMRG